MISRLFNKIITLKNNVNTSIAATDIVALYKTVWDKTLLPLTTHPAYDRLDALSFSVDSFVSDDTKFCRHSDYSADFETTFVAVDTTLSQVIQAQLHAIECMAHRLPHELVGHVSDAVLGDALVAEVRLQYETAVVTWLLDVHVLPLTYHMLCAHFPYWQDCTQEKTGQRVTFQRLAPLLRDEVQRLNERYHPLQQADYFSADFFDGLLPPHHTTQFAQYQRLRANRSKQSMSVFFLNYFFVASRLLGVYEQTEVSMSSAFYAKKLQIYEYKSPAIKNRLLGFHVPEIEEIQQTLINRSWIKSRYFISSVLLSVAAASYMLYTTLYEGAAYPMIVKEMVGISLVLLFFLFLWEVQIKSIFDEQQFYIGDAQWYVVSIGSVLLSGLCFYQWWESYAQTRHITRLYTEIGNSRWHDPLIEIVQFDGYFMLGYALCFVSAMVLMFSIPMRGNRLMMLGWIVGFLFCFFISLIDVVSASVVNAGSIYPERYVMFLSPALLLFLVPIVVLNRVLYAVLDKSNRVSLYIEFSSYLYHLFLFTFGRFIIFVMILLKGSVAFYSADLLITYILALILLFVFIWGTVGIDMRYSSTYLDRFIDRYYPKVNKKARG